MPKRLSISVAIRLRILNSLNKLFKTYRAESYSQFGEDIALLKMMKYKYGINNGFYVDVGCNHPRAFSNTFLLYLNGWQGLTVDLNQDLIKLHQIERKLDIQKCAAVSNKNDQVNVYLDSSSLMSTIDTNFYEEHKQEYQSDISSIQTTSLNQLLESTDIKSIDLLCIDVEGHDYEVLESISLEKYVPKIIIIEMHNCDLDSIKEHKIYQYLELNGYYLEGYLFWNGYFIHNSVKQKLGST